MGNYSAGLERGLGMAEARAARARHGSARPRFQRRTEADFTYPVTIRGEQGYAAEEALARPPRAAPAATLRVVVRGAWAWRGPGEQIVVNGRRLEVLAIRPATARQRFAFFLCRPAP
jgi:hypothetical protein